MEPDSVEDGTIREKMWGEMRRRQCGGKWGEEGEKMARQLDQWVGG